MKRAAAMIPQTKVTMLVEAGCIIIGWEGGELDVEAGEKRADGERSKDMLSGRECVCKPDRGVRVCECVSRGW